MLLLILQIQTVEASGMPSELAMTKHRLFWGVFFFKKKTSCFGMQGIFLVVFDWSQCLVYAVSETCLTNITRTAKRSQLEFKDPAGSWNISKLNSAEAEGCVFASLDKMRHVSLFSSSAAGPLMCRRNCCLSCIEIGVFVIFSFSLHSKDSEWKCFFHVSRM